MSKIDGASKLREAKENLPDWVEVNDFTALQEIYQNRHTIQPVKSPRLYQIETTSRCNLKCGFCPRTEMVASGGAHRDMNADMPLVKFRNILDDFDGLESIELFHFGEPFMHDNLHDYIRACKERGIYVVVASNLLPATPRKIDAAFDAGLDFLVMDVDSLDPDRYAAARVGGSLDILQKRVNYILNHPKAPYTVAQTIMLDGNKEYELGEFVEWAGGRPDEIRYKFLDSFRGTNEKPGGLAPHEVCREPFYGMTIHVNGDVVACDRDWAGENVMGNVHVEPVQEIWEGDLFNEFRRRMKSENKPDMCKVCPEGCLVNMRSQPNIQVNMFKGDEVKHQT